MDQTVEKILLTKAQNGGRHPTDVLTDYLDAGSREATEERIKVIIGFSRGSLEKLKRIYEAIFPSASWSLIWRDKNIQRRLAEFLIDPRKEETFIPQFIRESFFVPDNWIDLLQEKDYLRATIMGSLQSKYAVSVGDALEEQIRAVCAANGFDTEKGAVGIVDDKEVDIATPNTSNPRILIMSSYQLTTSSSQTSKANEQTRMYEDVRRHNSSRSQRDNPDVVFVNVIDGGGWLARPRDLQTMWRECDYCFAHSNLAGLQAALNHHMTMTDDLQRSAT